MSRESKKREAKKLERLQARRVLSNGRNDALMMQAARQLETAQANIELTQSRADFWRNLLVASAFARGLGNERPISEVVEESVPALLGINRPMVPA